MTKEEILNYFKGYEVAYVSGNATKFDLPKLLRPIAIIYKRGKIIGFFRYIDGDVKNILSKLENNFILSHDEEGYAQVYNVKDYHSLCTKIFSKEKAKCMANLFFDIYPKFNKFHNYWTDIVPKNVKGGLYCGIVCDNSKSKLTEDTLRLIHSKYNISTSFEDDVKIVKLKNQTCFLIGIIIFYHMLNPNRFGHKINILGKLKLKKGKKYEVIGKDDFEAQDDPNRNLLHPDNLNEDQEVKMGLVHKKALEFVKSKK